MRNRRFSTGTSRWRRVAPALGLLPLLTGCVAAVAIPILTGGTLMMREKARVRAATSVPAAAAPEMESATPANPSFAITTLKELPPPDAPLSAAPDERWQRFFSYALEQSRAVGAGGRRPLSALLAQPPSIDAPSRAECMARQPAVIIDLDRESAPFAPERLAAAPAGMAEGLGKLREAGIVILWISELPASRASDVAQALRTSGLDPQGQDQLLLKRSGDDRKQSLREDAGEDVCLVAIAGDSRADFDELFDYLRNPGAAAGLYPMMGQGWFLIPAAELPPSGED